MRKRMRRIISFGLLTVFCLLQTGCKFIYFEEEVLANPRTEVVDNSEEEEEVATDGTEDGIADGTEGSTNNISSTAGATNTEPKLTGTLEIQIFTNESKSCNAAWTKVLNNFEEKTGVRITAYMGSQVNTQMTKRWMGNNPPDLALLDGGGIPVEALQTSGALYDLTELLQTGYVYGTNDKIWDVTNHNIFERLGKNEPYYRAGFQAAAYGILYDENYLAQLGVTAPENYDELMNTFLPAVKAKGAAAFTTYGTTGSYPTWAMVMPAIAAYGQEYLDDVLLGTKEAWQRPEVRSVLERWATFSSTEGAVLNGTKTYDHTVAQMKWLNHQSVLIGNGIWLPWEVETSTPSNFQMNFKSSPLILAGQKPTVLAWPSSFIVAKEAKNLENAKAFIRYLYTKEVQEILVGAYGYIGARTDMDYVNLPGISAASKRIISYVYSNKVNLCWKRYNWGYLNDTVNGVTAGLMNGEKTVDQAIQELYSKGN